MSNKKIAGLFLIGGGIIYIYFQLEKCEKKNVDGSSPIFGIPIKLLNK